MKDMIYLIKKHLIKLKRLDFNLTLLIFILVIFSCEKNLEIITKNQIGKYQLGSEIKEELKDTLFDLQTDEKNRISSIITYSDQYETKDGFGVGSNIKEIQEKYQIDSDTMKLRKSSVIIGTIGESLMKDGIIFVDTNMDHKIDLVWINSDK